MRTFLLTQGWTSQKGYYIENIGTDYPKQYVRWEKGNMVEDLEELEGLEIVEETNTSKLILQFKISAAE